MTVKESINRSLRTLLRAKLEITQIATNAILDEHYSGEAVAVALKIRSRLQTLIEEIENG